MQARHAALLSWLLALAACAAPHWAGAAAAGAAAATTTTDAYDDDDGIQLPSTQHRRLLRALGSDGGDVSAAVSNGVNAARSDFPYFALLFGADGEEYGCGGALIRPSVVATAAHCMFDDENNNARLPNPVSVAVGLWHLSDYYDGEPGVDYQERAVKKTLIAPTYNPNSEDEFDIALLILARPITSIRPIALPPLNLRLAPNEPLWAAGFGTTQSSDETPEVLQKVSLPFMPTAKCNRIEDMAPIPSTAICAGKGSGAQDTCPGDSGGPLVRKKRGAPDVLVGLTSYGGEAECGQTNVGAYTYMASRKVRGWMEGVFRAQRV